MKQELLTDSLIKRGPYELNKKEKYKLFLRTVINIEYG